jgi:hypothetical protein
VQNWIKKRGAVGPPCQRQEDAEEWGTEEEGRGRNGATDLEEGAGDSDEEGGGGPEEGPGGDDAGAVVARGGVGGERVAGGLDERAAEREGSERRRGGAQRGTHLPVHGGEQHLVGLLQNGRQVHQHQRPAPLRRLVRVPRHPLDRSPESGRQESRRGIGAACLKAEMGGRRQSSGQRSRRVVLGPRPSGSRGFSIPIWGDLTRGARAAGRASDESNRRR